MTTAERIDEVRRRFERGDSWFSTSPLYRQLARVVAGDDELLDLAACARAGQQPPNMLMAATHMLVLEDPALPLAAFFPSVVGDAARPPAEAGPVFAAFCREHRGELEAILRQRLVQTNVPARAAAVRLAMREVARRVEGPAFLLEIGPSAGIQLRFERWATVVGGARFGPADAPLTVTTEWRGEAPVPDLDAVPPIAGRLGVDLHPVDVTDPAERLWLKALIWPEHRERFEQLDRALEVLAADQPEIVEGDAIEMLPRLDRERLPEDVPVVALHMMVRLHVPRPRQPEFDAAIEDLGRRRRLFHVSLEARPQAAGTSAEGHLLRLEDSAGAPLDIALFEGHGRWVEPLAGPARSARLILSPDTGP